MARKQKGEEEGGGQQHPPPLSLPPPPPLTTQGQGSPAVAVGIIATGVVPSPALLPMQQQVRLVVL